VIGIWERVWFQTFFFKKVSGRKEKGSLKKGGELWAGKKSWGEKQQRIIDAEDMVN